MPVVGLLLQEGVEQNGVQVFRDSSIIFCGYCHHLFDRHDAVDNIQSIKRFLGPSDPVSFFPGTGRANLGIGITHISVFQFFRVGRAVHIEYEPPCGDGMPKQP